MKAQLINVEHKTTDKIAEIAESLICAGIDFKLEAYVFYVSSFDVEAANEAIS